MTAVLKSNNQLNNLLYKCWLFHENCQIFKSFWENLEPGILLNFDSKNQNQRFFDTQNFQKDGTGGLFDLQIFKKLELMVI